MTNSPRPPGNPIPRLEHHTLERYESVWLGIAAVMAVLLFASTLASFISGTYPALRGEGGHHISGVTNGRLDPRNIAATPFAQPGLRENPDGSLEAFVVAKAFAFEPAVLRVPAGRPVTFHVTSADVMHGYEVAGTNINVTAIPGQVTSFSTTFRQPGTHTTLCNEYCGIGHHNMINRVVVEAPQAP
ncbi:cytochrome c oxidase, subunit II [Deinococcus geothermalis DSM 11300]|uniref:Cytochrome c oxidase, subunit II n=1 Tax=Deinococcus geothermalis (strain DSM 11300 / CIP 105573 / AG-3a) TaxID=319795 RepID=Q1J2G4_DEIGD|nr:cytochrome c oxidase subunit II [Deinococcus geothermalis]ABF44320.1 cytochrome c oxidase, subunit II [Deinococcus geothermalis DSM 11300]